MKTRFLMIPICLIFLSVSFTLKGQNGCSNPGCINDTLNISTGFDQGTSTYKTPLALESNWKLTAVPSNTTISPTGPVWVISPNSAWGNYSNAKWVSPFQNNLYSVNNPPLPASPYYGPFTFKNCFCLCQQTTVRIKFDYMGDDETEAYLDGTTLLASGITYMSGHFTLASQLSVDTVITLAAGSHCLSVDLYNVGSGAMGFALQGYISGANMLSSMCCNPTGSICGTKLKDVNCDSTINQNTDPGLAGWSIILKDSNGVPIDTMVTDTQGNYCFHDLPVGTYFVSEIGKPGWAQTYPGGSGSHTVTLTPTSAVIASFGNCHTSGNICGTKYKDLNCDSTIGPADPPLSGWTILLKDSNGTVIDSATTDAHGQYCFNDVPPGVYNVSEVSQPSWVQTYPGGSGSYTITVTQGGQYNAVFANCNLVRPCDSIPDFNVQVQNCMATFTAMLANLTGGSYQIVSTSWDFGDGSSSSLTNPVHFYTTPGFHNVCLTVTLFDGQQCCKRQVCKPVNIRELCHGGCTIQAQISDSLIRTKCTYIFNGIVINSGVPVTSWFWDFGDGTTGMGSTISHQFPSAGNYNVCLTLFGSFNGQCCFVKICKMIRVECDPCKPNGGSDPKEKSMQAPSNNNKDMGSKSTDLNMNTTISKITLSDKNVIVLNQNVPNPFAESTVITYNIPSKFAKAQILFTTTDGKVIKTVDILSKGEGRITVFADDLSTGIYRYTLIIDGKSVNSKTMMKN